MKKKDEDLEEFMDYCNYAMPFLRLNFKTFGKNSDIQIISSFVSNYYNIKSAYGKLWNKRHNLHPYGGRNHEEDIACDKAWESFLIDEGPGPEIYSMVKKIFNCFCRKKRPKAKDMIFFLRNKVLENPLHFMLIMDPPENLSGLRAPSNNSPFVKGKRMLIGDLFWYNGNWYIIVDFDHGKGITYVRAANNERFSAPTSAIKDAVKDGTINQYNHNVGVMSPLRSLWLEQCFRTLK